MKPECVSEQVIWLVHSICVRFCAPQHTNVMCWKKSVRIWFTMADDIVMMMITIMIMITMKMMCFILCNWYSDRITSKFILLLLLLLWFYLKCYRSDATQFHLIEYSNENHSKQSIRLKLMNLIWIRWFANWLIQSDWNTYESHAIESHTLFNLKVLCVFWPLCMIFAVY